MSCSAFEERIALYAGRDLDAAEVRPLREHLRECPACSELMAALEADRQWLSARPPEIADVDFARMRAEVRLAIGRKQWRWLPWAATAAALAGLGILAVAPGHQSRRIDPWGRPPGLPGGTSFSLPGSTSFSLSVPPAKPHAIKPAPHPQPAVSMEALMQMIDQIDASEPDSTGTEVEMRIATQDPNIAIVLVQETKGDMR